MTGIVAGSQRQAKRRTQRWRPVRGSEKNSAEEPSVNSTFLVEFPYLDRFGSARPVEHLELDLIAHVQGLETLARHIAVMNERFRALRRGDEPLALGIVEPFYFPGRHETSPCQYLRHPTTIHEQYDNGRIVFDLTREALQACNREAITVLSVTPAMPALSDENRSLSNLFFQ